MRRHANAVVTDAAYPPEQRNGHETVLSALVFRYDPVHQAAWSTVCSLDAGTPR
jgi:hypothetical protein